VAIPVAKTPREVSSMTDRSDIELRVNDTVRRVADAADALTKNWQAAKTPEDRQDMAMRRIATEAILIRGELAGIRAALVELLHQTKPS
jgi:hypothetical protein